MKQINFNLKSFFNKSFIKNSHPIIIGGCYRSGTSLLRRLLDSHSNIHCGPEIKFFKDFYGDYINDDLSHVRFFSTARTLGLTDNELMNILGNSFIQCHKLAAKKRGKLRWADKNPENVLYMEQWYELLQGHMLFIFIVRNPLDIISSLIEVKFDKSVPISFEGKVATCKNFVESGLNFINKYPEISYIIRYEDLVIDPEKSLKQLLVKLGEKFEPSMLVNFNSDDRQKGIEDPKVTKSNIINIDSIGRWKNDLNNDQIDYIYKQLNVFMNLFGYNSK